jgi:hypothetical protein
MTPYYAQTTSMTDILCDFGMLVCWYALFPCLSAESARVVMELTEKLVKSLRERHSTSQTDYRYNSTLATMDDEGVITVHADRRDPSENQHGWTCTTLLAKVIKSNTRNVYRDRILEGDRLLESTFPTPMVPALACRNPRLVYASPGIVGHLPPPCANLTLTRTASASSFLVSAQYHHAFLRSIPSLGHRCRSRYIPNCNGP